MNIQITLDLGLLNRLRQEFGLSYHVDNALIGQELVGFAGKRVLEVGGSLPEKFALGYLGAAQWVALEEMNYWTETLSTGLVSGTPPEMKAARQPFTSATVESLQPYNLFHGSIEQLPTALEGQFDMVFSIAAFEHIPRLPLALEKMRMALKPGGKLFSMFSPVWSSHHGHHLPEIRDKAGRQWSFSQSPIPLWGHLLLRPAELLDLLMRSMDADTAREIVYFVYSSPHISRFFLDDYIEFVMRSGFIQHCIIPICHTPPPPPPQIQALLQERYPGRTDFVNGGLLLVLERGQ